MKRSELENNEKPTLKGSKKKFTRPLIYVIGLSLIAFSILAVIQNTHSQKKVKEISQIHVATPFSLSQLFNEINLASNAQNKFFETGDSIYESQRKKIWSDNIKPIANSLLKIESSLEDKDKKLVEKAVSTLEDYEIAQEELNIIWKETKQSATPRDKAGAENMLTEKRLALKMLTEDDATSILIPIQDKYQKKVDAELNFISDSTRKSTYTISLAILSTLLLTAILYIRQKELVSARKHAEINSLAKSDFLSIMSHEIRTPINGVIGIANLLKEENLTHKQAEYVRTLSFSAEHLLSLVSDILDFSKIEAGKLHLEKTSFHLETVCKRVFDLYKSKAEEKGIAYTFTPTPIKDYSLYGDPTRLSQVLSNLISNAIKFTDKGGVDFSYRLNEAAVELSYKVRQDNNHMILVDFIIKDTGIGIPENKKDKIFESFSQADKSTTRQFGGTGLGLTICKKIIDVYGGTIEVNSQPGEGSEFIVSIPFEKHVYTNSEEIERNARKTFTEDLTGMRILVAEDNHINAMVLTRFLKKWNAEYTVAKDGREALELVHEGNFDIILMDLQMPVMDGIEATNAIRNMPNDIINKIPIVAFTADAVSENHSRLLKQGFSYCLTKPFHPETLLQFLKKYHTDAA